MSHNEFSCNIPLHGLIIDKDDKRIAIMAKIENNLKWKRRLRNILLPFLVTLIFIAILFIAAGSLTWINGWVLVLIMLAGNILSIALLDPGLLEERTGVKSGFKREDVILATIMGRLGPLALIIIAGLDFRFGWSAPLPVALGVLGFVFLVIGFALILWAMRENKFFSSVVRIQKERGHYTITSGPYRLVRHPGYLGSIIYMLGLPFALTSYWALIPAVVTNIIAVIRTTLEDRTLKRQLEGYAPYMERVQYRLLPGIW